MQDLGPAVCLRMGCGPTSLSTFHQLVDQCPKVICLFLFPLAHLNDISKVLAHILE